MSAETLVEAVRSFSKELKLGLEEYASHLQASVDIGDLREEVVEKFLRPLLPPRVGLAKGEVFASDGTRSKQLDIILYDAIDSLVLMRGYRRVLLPAESIYGSIEIKSELNTAALEMCCENVLSVKSLRRDATDMLDFSPNVRVPLDTVFDYDRDVKNPYICPVLSLRGAVPSTLLSVLNKRFASDPTNRTKLPDIVCVVDPGYLLMRLKVHPAERTRGFTPPGRDYDGFVGVDCGEDAIPFFFFTLNYCLSWMRLRSPSLLAPWDMLARMYHNRLIVAEK